MKRSGQRGVTLVELLVALLVFAMIAGVATYSLRLGVGAGEQLDAAEARLRELEAVRMLMKEDFLLAVGRPARDAFGFTPEQTFLGGSETRLRGYVEGERLLVAFVRSGWANPENAAPRSSLQYVEYVAKGDALVRRTRPYVDAARGQALSERVILRDAKDARMTFLAGATPSGLLWAEGWPIGGSGQGLPQAVALTVTTNRFGAIEQRFWIGAEQVEGEGA